MKTDDIVSFMTKNGLSETNAKSLKNAIINQHNVVGLTKSKFSKAIYEKSLLSCTTNERNRIDELYSQFDNKTDFSHMFATISMNYIEPSKSTNWGMAITNKTNADMTLTEASGYKGDIFGITFKEPSMANDDYTADLDAVNIYQRSYNNNGNLLITMIDYYSDLDSGLTNRANEFIVNIGGLDKLNKSINDYSESFLHDPTIALNFYNSLSSSSNTYQYQ